MENLCTLKLAKRRRKDGTELHLGGGKTACGCVWVAKRRHGAAFERWKDGTELHFACNNTAGGGAGAVERRQANAFGLQKDGTELHFACNNTARSGVWVVERWHGAAFGRHCACNNTAAGGIRAATGVLPRSLQCAKTRSHAKKAPCTCNFIDTLCITK